MPHAKIVHRRHRWIANSAAQWCEETQLTNDQYRRAVALLRNLGFVETEQHLFGRKNVTHVRITSIGDEIRTRACLGSSQIAPVKSGKTATHQWSSNAQLLIQEVSYLESLQGETTVALASAHANLGNEVKVDTGKQASIINGKKSDESVTSSSTHSPKGFLKHSKSNNLPDQKNGASWRSFRAVWKLREPRAAF
jgi:hypothetical protein